MIESVLLVAAGMFIGWNFLPQPKWVKNLWTKATDSVESED